MIVKKINKSIEDSEKKMKASPREALHNKQNSKAGKEGMDPKLNPNSPMNRIKKNVVTAKAHALGPEMKKQAEKTPFSGDPKTPFPYEAVCKLKPFGTPVSHNWAVWLVLFILFCVAIYVLRSVLLPFVAGTVLGYLFDPMASRFEKWGMSRTWATVFVFAIIVIIAVPALILLFGLIDEQLTIFVDAAPRYIASFIQRTEPILASLQERFPELEIANLKNIFKDNMTNGVQIGGKVLKGLINNGFALINLISLLLIMPVVAFYMLRDWDTFVHKVDNLLPRKSKKTIREQFRQIDLALSGFIRGQLSVCVILGTYYSIGLRLVGLELGLLVGFLAGLISFIPYVGSISGFVVSIILALAQFDDMTKVLEVVAVFAIGQFVEGNFLTPKLVGDNIGLHPVWVMFALLAGGVLLGFLGLMIAVPVAAIIGVLTRYAINNYKKSNLYLED